jgi:hypothetical protein
MSDWRVIVAPDAKRCSCRYEHPPLTLDCRGCGAEIRMHPHGGDIPRCCERPELFSGDERILVGRSIKVA